MALLAPPRPGTPKNAPRSDRSALVVLAAGLLHQALGKLGPLADSDVWWHLRTGELILGTGAVPAHDPFSWTAPGAPWAPNAWLGEVLFTLLHRLGGPAALASLRALTVAGFGVLTYLVARRAGARPWPSSVAAIVATFALYPYVTERPLLFTIAAFPLLLLAVPRALSGSRPALLSVAVLVAVWVNLHGGFVAGVGLTGLLALGSVLSRRDVRRPLLVVGVAAAAGLLNPFGLQAYLRPLRVRGISSWIEEWQPLDPGAAPDQVVLLFAVAAALALLRTGRWRRPEVLLPFFVFLGATLDAVRNGPFLVALAVPELALAFGTVRAPVVGAWTASRRRPLLTGLALAWVALVIGTAPLVARTGHPDASLLPLDTTAAIPEGCRLLNEYEFGGYVIWSRWPEVPVSQDGRNDVYPPALLEAQERALAGDLATFRRLDPQCVLARPGRPVIALLEDAGWERLAADPVAVLLVEGGR